MTARDSFINSLVETGILADTGKEEFIIKEPLKKKYLMISYIPDDVSEAEKVQTMAQLYADKIGAELITDISSIEDPKSSMIIRMDIQSLYENAVV